MRVELPFNPLDKRNLGTSVAEALLAQQRSPLPPGERFIAAGVYAIYYQGSFEPYRPIAIQNLANNGKDVPIYIGKAVPAGARKGGFGLDSAPGAVLFNRLLEHSESINQVENLSLSDFFCRYLAVDDIWIPLGENLLIEMFSPLWNRVIEGFGNHDPGSGRHQGKRPAWDILHPGRPWASKLQPGKSHDAIISDVLEFLSGPS
ncbi:MAG: Eco29kI family restriction endonuclease, partial [Bryobacterales bacterium]|nr:Eco29kI family restriction endonuclease [Bryobacterales bacterium]